MFNILTASGQLAIASEYRLVYWKPDTHGFYTVALGTGACDGRWAICDTDKFGACWNGEKWSREARGLEAFRYTDREEALLIARGLAIEKNQEIIKVMEMSFPGQFRNGEYDLRARKEET